jgi:phosphate transport system permease protein
MHIRGLITKIWAYAGIIIVSAVVVFLFVFVFIKGGSTITWEFLSTQPSGLVLGSEG